MQDVQTFIIASFRSFLQVTSELLPLSFVPGGFVIRNCHVLVFFSLMHLCDVLLQNPVLSVPLKERKEENKKILCDQEGNI